jgi:hypothetical protein
VEVEPIDLVVEGQALKVSEPETLRRVADAYASIYDWHVAVRKGAFHNTEGAPTAGPPPYDVYEVVPATAFAFGTDEWEVSGAEAAVAETTPALAISSIGRSSATKSAVVVGPPISSWHAITVTPFVAEGP